MVWREAVGWQVEGMVDFDPNMVSSLMTLGLRRWYIVGVYAAPNDEPVVHRVHQALRVAPKELEVFFLGDLNVRLRNPCDEREEDPEMAMAMADCGLVDIKEHFLP